MAASSDSGHADVGRSRALSRAPRPPPRGPRHGAPPTAGPARSGLARRRRPRRPPPPRPHGRARDRTRPTAPIPSASTKSVGTGGRSVPWWALIADAVQPSISSTRVTPTPARDDRDRGARGGGDVGERDPQHDRVLGDPVQAQRQLGDHRERALGADQEAEQVVAGGRLRRRAPRPDHAAVGQHRLEGEHVLAHLPVAHRRRPRRVRRGHPAERGVGARVDGEEQAVLGGGALEGAPGHAGLDGRGEIRRRDRERSGPSASGRARCRPPPGSRGPSRLVPAPNGVTGTRCSSARASTARHLGGALHAGRRRRAGAGGGRRSRPRGGRARTRRSRHGPGRRSPRPARRAAPPRSLLAGLPGEALRRDQVAPPRPTRRAPRPRSGRS